MYVLGCVLYVEGKAVGEFSSHWAACTAMLRLSNPDFESLGGDKPEDLEVERQIQEHQAHG